MAAPVLDGTVATFNGTLNGSDQAVFAVTVSANANRYLVVDIAMGLSSAAAVGTVTYNGVTMTLIVDSGLSINSQARVLMYGLVAPATGSFNVVVPFTGVLNDDRMACDARPYKDVDQSTPTGTANSATFDSTTPTVNIAAAVGDLVIDAASCRGATPLTVGAGQTQRANVTDASGSGSLASSDEAGATSVTMSWSGGDGNDTAIAGVALKAAGGGGPTAKTGDDTATGTEGTPGIALANPRETGTGAETNRIDATLAPAQDTATGTEGVPTIALGALTDSGAGAETQSVVVVQTGSDTGTFDDSITEIAISSGGESGTGSDNGSVSATAGPGESGSGAEGNSITATLVSSESGVGTETATVVQTGTNPVDSDSGTGSDAAIVEALLASLDSGVGTESADLVVTLVAAETGTGSDTGFLTEVQWWASDTGVGVDTASVLGPTTYTGIALGVPRIRPRLTGGEPNVS